MDKSKIVQLRLLKNDFTKFEFSEDYKVVPVDKSNYQDYLTEMVGISALMSLDFEWVGIPNEETIVRRFKSNSHCLLWKYNELNIGWAWSNSNVTPLWEEPIQKLKDDEIYGGGAFLSRKIERPPNSGVMFYNLTFDYWFNEMNNNSIFQYSDSWNRVSSFISYKNGFKRYNFLN